VRPRRQTRSALVEQIADRAEALLACRGFRLDEDQDEDPDDALVVVQAAAVTGRSAVQRSRQARRDQMHGVTKGMATILYARRVVLLPTGGGKAQAGARAVLGPPTENHLASIFQEHPYAVLVADRAAASDLLSPLQGDPGTAREEEWQCPT